MALAENKIITEEQIVEVEVDREVILTLNKDEAYALAVVLASVGGRTGTFGNQTSARQLTHNISVALAGAGVDWCKVRGEPGFQTSPKADSIVFESVTQSEFDEVREAL